MIGRIESVMSVGCAALAKSVIVAHSRLHVLGGDRRGRAGTSCPSVRSQRSLPKIAAADLEEAAVLLARSWHSQATSGATHSGLSASTRSWRAARSRSCASRRSARWC